MGSEELRGAATASRPFTNPWPALFTGLAANAAAFLWYQALGNQMSPLALLGLLATGAAVAIRPQSAAVLGLAALAGLLAAGGLQTWDSAQLMVAVLSGVAAFAAVMVLLPQVVRRLIISLMIVVHFAGIVCAVLQVPPTPPVTNWAFMYFYRYPLQFMYLTNAYHFYSPEPGPGILVWFYVQYEDGAVRKVEIPCREDNPLKLEYQRRLSLAESVNQLLPTFPIPPEIRANREFAGNLHGIPLHPMLDPSRQYQVPNGFSKQMLETYARYVARTTPHPTDPDKKVTGVKIYRVVHYLPAATEIAAGQDPGEKHWYYPYYQGDFTPEGKLKNSEDPYLYWLIPIVKTHDLAAFRAGKFRSSSPPSAEQMQILDLVEEHVKLKTQSPEGSKLDAIPGGPEPEKGRQSPFAAPPGQPK